MAAVKDVSTVEARQSKAELPPPPKVSGRRFWIDILGFVFLIALAVVVWWFLPDKPHYAVLYSVDMNRVFVEPRPSDCDFSRAPIGDKGCHYEKVVTTEKGDTGKTTGVYVSWNKVKEP